MAGSVTTEGVAWSILQNISSRVSGSPQRMPQNQFSAARRGLDNRTRGDAGHPQNASMALHVFHARYAVLGK